MSKYREPINRLDALLAQGSKRLEASPVSSTGDGKIWLDLDEHFSYDVLMQANEYLTRVGRSGWVFRIKVED
jgi:hypothetical protein